MLLKTSETLNLNTPAEEEIDVEGLKKAAEDIVISETPHPKIYADTLGYQNQTLQRNGEGIGGAHLAVWNDAENAMKVVEIEDFSMNDTYYNHSGYLALLQNIAKQEPDASLINGFATNEAAAIVLDLDTFGLMPEGWRASYFDQTDKELQYPFEVYDAIASGQPVHHILERTLVS